MKAVILAGGQGKRMGDKVMDRPKPMLEVGGRPLLCHLMELCSAQGVNEFIIALGYQGRSIKDYFLRYNTLHHDVSIDLRSGQTTIHQPDCPDWRIHLIETGTATMTGGRLKRLASWLHNAPHFLMTYGDGLANINLNALEDYHISHGRLATVTAVQVEDRFGRLALEADKVKFFQEKPLSSRPWINGGFFVLSPKVLDYIEHDNTLWEREPLEQLCAEDQLRAYRHDGFWTCVDTPQDLSKLDAMWWSGQKPWLISK